MKKKRITKFIIYVLTTVIIGTGVASSYHEARSVKAVVVVDDTLILLSILGAMGIVYIGANWYGSNLAEDWYPDYEDELAGIADNVANIWDSELYQAYSDGSIPDPDDFDPDNDNPEDKPPKWQQLVDWIKANPDKVIAIGGTAIGAVMALVSKAIQDEVDDAEKYSLDSETLKELPYWIRYYYSIDNQDTITYYFNYPPIFIGIDTSSRLCFGARTSEAMYFKPIIDGGDTDGSINSTLNTYSTPYRYNFMEYIDSNFPYPIVSDTPIDYGYFDVNNTRFNSNRDPVEVGGINLPVSNMLTVGESQVQALLQALYDATALTEAERELAYQTAVDNFIAGIEPSSESGTDVDPEPTPGPGGDTDTEEDPDLDNSSFLADLSHLFPFCIPFDLIDCFRLLSAEPETPHVEFPIHFGIVDFDYTFVIDFSDFDGVAKICRTSFLLMYIVGLVMITRPLIRG